MVSIVKQFEFITFCVALNELHDSHPFSVTSWFRTESHNHLVGGVKTSKHLIGLGVDCVLDDMADSERKLFCEEAKAYGLRAIDEKSHIHLQVDRSG